MPGETLKVRKPYVISIIDDDPLVREGIARLVRSLGHRSNVFSSAEEYLDAGGVDECNCLITDLHMPGMNGAELREHLVAAGNRVPVIFITSYFDEKIRARLLQAGAAGFLRKPFSYEGFAKCLNTTLKNSGRRSTKK
jgi:FixJ family two-component response regulator